MKVAQIYTGLSLGVIAPQEVLNADDDSLIEPAMPSDKTDALNHTLVEVVEELSRLGGG